MLTVISVVDTLRSLQCSCEVILGKIDRGGSEQDINTILTRISNSHSVSLEIVKISLRYEANKIKELK